MEEVRIFRGNGSAPDRVMVPANYGGGKPFTGEDGIHMFLPDGLEHEVASTCWCEPAKSFLGEKLEKVNGNYPGAVPYFEHRAPA